MLIENCPIINVNVKVWLFWAYLRKPKWYSYLLGCVPVTVLNVFQFMNLFNVIASGSGDMNKIIIDGYFTVLYFNLVLRTSFLMGNRGKFETFLEGIADEYAVLEVRVNGFLIFLKSSHTLSSSADKNRSKTTSAH